MKLPKRILFALAKYSLDLFKTLLYNSKAFVRYYEQHKDDYLDAYLHCVSNKYETYTALPNGLPHGQYRSYSYVRVAYNEVRILSEMRHYRLGLLHGDAYLYNSKSQIIRHTKYMEGQIEGPHLLYDENGNIRVLSLYLNNYPICLSFAPDRHKQSRKRKRMGSCWSAGEKEYMKLIEEPFVAPGIVIDENVNYENIRTQYQAINEKRFITIKSRFLDSSILVANLLAQDYVYHPEFFFQNQDQEYILLLVKD